jgi:ATP-dependent exoDNAse (exonuclease V) alpha subunit
MVKCFYFMTQQEALNILKTGASVFLTGEPGSGKTYAVNEYAKYLRGRGIEPAITASTGIAATHIGGTTVHSWSGICVKNSLSPSDLSSISAKKRIVRNVKKSNTLIIDEVSMLSGNTLSMVDAVCRSIRENNSPFGGMQAILVGDFFQLPPVFRGEEGNCFAYESDAWKELNPMVCYLTEQHRQRDKKFLSALSAIRTGTFEESHRLSILSRMREIEDVPENVPKIFPHNADVDKINAQKLSKIEEKLFSFRMESAGPKALVDFLRRSCLSPELLDLKKGAAVMFTKNHPRGLFVNGTLGEIIGFDGEKKLPIVKARNGHLITAEPMEWAIEEDNKIKAKICQIPLRLAWAITVHKSQGMSMDEAVVDLSSAFEYGQGYVALSRVRSFAGLYLLGANERAFLVHPEVLERDRHFRLSSEDFSEEFGLMEEKELRDRQKKFTADCGGREPK